MDQAQRSQTAKITREGPCPRNATRHAPTYQYMVIHGLPPRHGLRGAAEQRTLHRPTPRLAYPTPQQAVPPRKRKQTAGARSCTWYPSSSPAAARSAHTSAATAASRPHATACSFSAFTSARRAAARAARAALSGEVVGSRRCAATAPTNSLRELPACSSSGPSRLHASKTRKRSNKPMWAPTTKRRSEG